MNRKINPAPCLYSALLFLLIGFVFFLFGLDEDDFFIGSIICGGLAVILFNAVIAAEFYAIAAKKGCSEVKYFWYCFLLTFAGYLMVIALPNNVTEKNTFSDELPEL